jgi:hypothetical protein
MAENTEHNSHGLDTLSRPCDWYSGARTTVPVPRGEYTRPLTRSGRGCPDRVFRTRFTRTMASSTEHDSHGLDTTVQTVWVVPGWSVTSTDTPGFTTEVRSHGLDTLSRPCELCSVVDAITRVNTETMASTTDVHSHGLNTPVQTVYFGRKTPAPWRPPLTPTHTVWTGVSRPCTLDRHPRHGVQPLHSGCLDKSQYAVYFHSRWLQG